MGNIQERVRRQSEDGSDDGGGSGALFLLCRTWAVVVPEWSRSRTPQAQNPNKTTNNARQRSDSDFDSSQFSYCSCSQCDRSDDLSDCFSDIFGTGSTMAPNSEEGGRLVPLSKSTQSLWSDDTLSKEKQRPPIYNPEDYAILLKKWGRRPVNGGPGLYTPSGGVNEPAECPKNAVNGVHNGTTRDYRNLMLTSGAGGEMTLRQFGTVSELLNKLRADLRLAFPSFVQEFIGDPLDGVTLLLELLRAIQLSQAAGGPPTNGTPGHTGTQGGSGGNGTLTQRVSPAAQRRALLDELACLQCLLCCCQRYSEAIRRLTDSSAGLFTLAVCIMSNVNKSRIIALELLTKVCEPPSSGHAPVSEALSTLRLRFGEPVRFRFLVGMLSSTGSYCELLAAGLRFLNTFLETAGSQQKRLYIQAELEQAGFDIALVKKIINMNSPASELVFSEMERWDRGHIDIETILIRLKEYEKDNDTLKDKIKLLEKKVKILQEEKGVLVSLEQCLKERCSDLQDEVKSLKTGKPYKNRTRNNSIKIDDSSPAEDEGISSSERSLTPENDIQRDASVYEIYSVQSETVQAKQMKVKEEEKKAASDDEEETTIEEVIEELRNIINDAETEAYAAEKKEQEDRQKQESNKIQMRVDLIEEETEAEIVPSNLHPQPPRRTRSLVHLYIPTEDYEYTNQKDVIFENETPFTSDESSDSLLSASRQIPAEDKGPVNGNTNRELLNTIMDARERAIIQEKRRQKKTEMIKALKRSESFQHSIPNVQLLDTNDHTLKTVKHNSFDGMYFVTNFSNAPSSPRYQKKSKDDFAKQRMKSKSLDRIDDGLDAMVDIIVTSDQTNINQRLQNTKSDSGHHTETSISRSTSNNYSKTQNFPSVNCTTKYEETRSRMFLPYNRYDNYKENNHHSFYFPRVQENPGNFMIKRGHTNAGLYSGHHVTRESPLSTTKRATVISSNSYRTTSSKNMNSMSMGKFTDLPSGLY